MKSNYKSLDYKELTSEIEHTKVLIFYSERSMISQPEIFANQTERLKKELALLEEQLKEVPPPAPAPKIKKSKKSKRIYS